MPLTKFQTQIARLLSKNRSEDSHLAGGAAIHLESQSIRFSNDLDYFHDSDARVAKSFEQDHELLIEHKYEIEIELRQPGYIRVSASKGADSTKIEWAHDTAWRFMPAVADPICGFRLHPIDLAINKVLALAGRNEARDYLDVIHLHKNLLPLGALCWAAAGKDPGLNPRSLLELLKRRGKFRQEDIDRLQLKNKFDIQVLKSQWLEAVEQAEAFIQSRPAEEVGCLYLSLKTKEFYAPTSSDRIKKDYQLHFGRPGGLIPLI